MKIKMVLLIVRLRVKKVIQISEKKIISNNHENDYFLVGTFIFRKAERISFIVFNHLLI